MICFGAFWYILIESWRARVPSAPYGYASVWRRPINGVSTTKLQRVITAT